MSIFDGKFQKTVLVVSSGRTGTKALAQHLSSCYPEVLALHEPKPSWRLRRASAKALSGRLSKAQLVQLLADSRRQLAAEAKRPIYVESNPFLGGFVEAFDEVFPNAHLVHVIRDPRTYIRSGINFGVFSGLKQLAVSMVPWWLPKPEHFSPPGEKRWSKMSGVERLAWYWAMLNTELNRGEQIYGPRYLRITFEELFAKDGHGLRRLTDFLGLPASNRLLEEANRENVNASTARRMPKWDQWEPALQKEVLDHCRDLMELYGYHPEPALA